MIVGALLGEGWAAMLANRMRTLLTMLGMVFGVGAVIMMMAIGQGAELKVNESIASMGSNLFIVLSGSTSAGGTRQGSGTVPTLTLADSQAISELPEIAAVAPNIFNSAQLIYASNNWSTQVAGTTPPILDVRDWHVVAGESFKDSDIRAATRVLLMGQTVVYNLFGDENPVGKIVRVKNSPFLVLGVLEQKGQSLDGRDQDDTVLVPITTAQRQLFGNQFPGMVRMILVKAKSAEVMAKAEQEMIDLLHTRHRIHADKENDFSVRNLTALAQAAASTTEAMSTMLGAIASVSLLVGGIGIMNIMLVSVTERTREIGIRMAIGARNGDILLQFLFEAVMISLAGSFIGAVLGIACAYLYSQVYETLAVVTLSSVLMAFGVAASVGVFFGFYPARKAANLKPIEALRFQ
jgi:putative ABC transport system permease protein